MAKDTGGDKHKLLEGIKADRDLLDRLQQGARLTDARLGAALSSEMASQDPPAGAPVPVPIAKASASIAAAVKRARREVKTSADKDPRSVYPAAGFMS